MGTAAGFELGPTPAQVELRDQLNRAAVPHLRTLAAILDAPAPDEEDRPFGRERSEFRASDAPNDDLPRHLREVGVDPATLLERGIDDPHTLLIAAEELAYGDAGIAWTAVPGWQLATVVGACGSGAQRAAAREVFAADPAAAVRVLLYEDFGRAPSELATRVGADGRVHGRKTSVAHPGAADITLLLARENAAGEPGNRVRTGEHGRDVEAAAEVDPGELAGYCWTGERPGVTVVRDDRAAGKVALTEVPTGPVELDGLAPARAERLAGGLELHRAVGQARLLTAGCLLGLARAAVEFAAAYATRRTTWGRPLAEYQGVSFPLVELATELDEVRLLVWDVAARLPGCESVHELERRVGRALARASSLALRATRDGVQLVGVRAITRDLPAERWYRTAAALAVVDVDVLLTPYGLN